MTLTRSAGILLLLLGVSTVACGQRQASPAQASPAQATPAAGTTPAGERGFWGGLAAWFSGEDRRQAEALEAEAERQESRAADAARQADGAALALARTQGEVAAASSFAQSPLAASLMLRDLSRQLAAAEAAGRLRLDRLREEETSFRRGQSPESRWRQARMAAQDEHLQARRLLEQAAGASLRLAGSGDTALRAALDELQDRRAALAAISAALQRALSLSS